MDGIRPLVPHHQTFPQVCTSVPFSYLSCTQMVRDGGIADVPDWLPCSPLPPPPLPNPVPCLSYEIFVWPLHDVLNHITTLSLGASDRRCRLMDGNSIGMSLQRPANTTITPHRVDCLRWDRSRGPEKIHNNSSAFVLMTGPSWLRLHYFARTLPIVV